MKVLKIVIGTWKDDSRDKRELSVYRELGADVSVLAKGEPDDRGRLDEVDGFPVYRYSSRPLGSKVPNALNRVISIFTWAHFAGTLRPDVITGHDISGLAIGWISGWFKKKKPKLVYDSHEFELGRNVKRGRAAFVLIKHAERFLMRRCAYSIMVNDSIADEVQRIHRLPERPIVVRSTPDNWEIDEKACRETRAEMLPPNAGEDGFLVMYHGMLTSMRGIEALIRLTAKNPRICAFILGDGQPDFVEKLHALASELGVEDRVVFHPAVALRDLWRYVGAADLSLMMIEGKAKSYYFALPNKFFESIQSLTPIVASDFPEMKRIIDRYEIGLTCSPDDLDAINDCVEKMRTDTAFYAKCKSNLTRAKAELCWAKEKDVLIKAFKEIE